MVRSMRAASTSERSSSCLKNLSSRLADGLPIATRIAAAFCGRVRARAVVTTRCPERFVLAPPSSGRLRRRDDFSQADAEARGIVVEHRDLAFGDLAPIDDNIDGLTYPAVECD